MKQQRVGSGHLVSPEERVDPGGARQEGQDLLGNQFLQAQVSGPPGAVAHVGGKANELEGGGEVAPPVLTDADAEQAEVITEALALAVEMAGHGLSRLSSGPSSEAEEELFAYHFGTDEPQALAEASSKLGTTLSGLSSGAPIQVESWMFPGMSDAGGYIWGGPFAGVSDIHLTPQFFQITRTNQASTLVHEGTHKWAGTGDHAYVHDAHYGDLPWDKAIDNADSYAAFCEGVQGRVEKAEAAEQEAREQEAADTHGALLWEAWKSGEISLWEDTFTTSDGVQVRKEIVARKVYAWFKGNYPQEYAEVVAACETQWDGPFTCASGLVVHDDLYQEIGAIEGVW